MSYLRELGHEVVGWARSGSEAVELAQQTSPDLAIIDIAMKGMDGIEAAAEIMQIRPLPIILLTAYADSDYVERASRAGVLAYLLKGGDSRQLEPAIRLSLARFKELQMLRQEMAGLREALETRQLVEEAKSILMRRNRMSEAAAFRLLRGESRRQRRKMADIARAVVTASPLFADGSPKEPAS